MAHAPTWVQAQCQSRRPRNALIKKGYGMSAETVCAIEHSQFAFERMGNHFPSPPPERPYAKLCLGNGWPMSILDRTRFAPSTIAFIFSNATFRGKYFRPQSGPQSAFRADKRQGPPNPSGHHFRCFNLVSERSNTPRIIVFPGKLR